MSPSEVFIRRPIATTLLLAGLALGGAVAFRLLPVSPLPQVDFPTISVSAALPGASPETMASSVATPLSSSSANLPCCLNRRPDRPPGSTSCRAASYRGDGARRRCPW